MLKRKVPIWLVLAVIAAVSGVGYRLDSSVAEASTVKKAKVWSNEDCLKCHTNKRILREMQSKRGDPVYCQAAYDRLAKTDGKEPSSSYSPQPK
jgi:hypothetical protein